MSDHALILMKMGMGRFPAVDVVVSGSLLTEAVEYYYKKKDAISYVVGSGVKPEAADPKNAIYIADLESTPTHLALLLVRGDPGGAVPAFVNPIERVVVAAKSEDPNFVRGSSCHLVISKQEIAAGTDTGRFRTAMERARGISRSLARDFLNQILARFAQEHPDRFIAEKKRRAKKEARETISYRPTVKFHPQQNGSLKKDLEEGRIGGFKLVRGTTEYKGEADEPALQRLDVQLQARIAPTSDFSKVKRMVDHIQQTLNAISFEALNLELVDDGGKHIDNTRAIAIDNLDEPDMRYCKTVSMDDLGNDVSECYGTFYNPIKSAAIKALQKNDYWV